MMVIVVIHHPVDGCEIMHQLYIYKCSIHLYPMISRLSTILLVQDFATIPRFLFPIAAPVRPLEGLAARMGIFGKSRSEGVIFIRSMNFWGRWLIHLEIDVEDCGRPILSLGK